MKITFDVKIGLMCECFPSEDDLILPSGEAVLLPFFLQGRVLLSCFRERVDHVLQCQNFILHENNQLNFMVLGLVSLQD